MNKALSDGSYSEATDSSGNGYPFFIGITDRNMDLFQPYEHFSAHRFLLCEQWRNHVKYNGWCKFGLKH